MKKISFYLLGMVVMLLTACTASNVAFTEARNYFHRNDAQLPSDLKLQITSAEEFERHFDRAAVMGKDGEPTPIDFSKSFVIAKVLPVSSLKTELRPLKLKKKGNRLDLGYKFKQGEKQSYATQPMFILIVDRKYMNYPISESVYN